MIKPFLQGRAVANSPSLHRPKKNGAIPAIPSGAGGLAQVSGACSPSVETVKEGDKVVRLIVTCACGERIEVECLYSAGR